MKALAILSLIQLCMISIGFALAYWLTPNVVGLATQIIMIGGLYSRLLLIQQIDCLLL